MACIKVIVVSRPHHRLLLLLLLLQVKRYRRLRRAGLADLLYFWHVGITGNQQGIDLAPDRPWFVFRTLLPEFPVQDDRTAGSLIPRSAPPPRPRREQCAQETQHPVLQLAI